MTTIPTRKDAIIAQLRTAHEAISPYPPKVVPIRQYFSGTAFFPAGTGFYGEGEGTEAPADFGGTFIVGHNFDSEVSYTKNLALGREDRGSPTWNNTLSLLKAAGINPRSCFFTNAFVGLIEGDNSIGRFPGSKDAAFTKACQGFLRLQIELLQPSLILTLGAFTPAFVAGMSPQLSTWSRVKSLRDLDAQGNAVVTGVRFRDLAPPVAVVALTHPSFPPNFRFRFFEGLSGRPAELALVAKAQAWIADQQKT